MKTSMRSIPDGPVTAGAGSAIRRLLLVALVAGTLSGCGSSASGTPGPGGTGAAGDATATPPVVDEPSQAASPAGGGDPGSGGTGSGGGSNGDVEAVAAALVPPHSTEVTKTTAADTWFAMYETTDSIDTLKAFYEDAIAKAGLQVISTTTANGGIAWAMATDASGSFGGAVSIFPTGDGKNAVQVTVGKS